MAAKKAKSDSRKPAPEDFRSDALAAALEKQDVAKTGDLALLLFSDAKNKPDNLPPGVGIYTADWLRKFLATHPITTVFLDIAGPHPMQASPEELLKALDA